MKLQEYLQAYAFEEIYPYIGLMFPKGRKLKIQFGRAYELLLSIEPIPSKKKIRYQLMQDPISKEIFCGADDNDFNSGWNVLLGKDVNKDSQADITNEEMVANCLLNVVLIGRHPKEFDEDFRQITESK